MQDSQSLLLLYNFLYANLDNLYLAYSHLEEEAKPIFLADLLGTYSGDFSHFIFGEEPQYFFPKVKVQPGDIVIDGGSYDGRTAKEFLDAGAKAVYSFELDEDNYPAVEKAAKMWGFVPENMGLWDTETSYNYYHSNTGSRVDAGGNAVAKLIDIDRYVAQKNIERVDFIKMDIEGSEAKALLGARETIRRFKPRLAICTYHKWQDMWELPLIVKQLEPSYKIYWRHYAPLTNGFPAEQKAVLDSYNVPNFSGTAWEKVMYCIAD